MEEPRKSPHQLRIRAGHYELEHLRLYSYTAWTLRSTPHRALAGRSLIGLRTGSNRLPMAARVSSCLDTAPSWSSACGRRAALNALTMRGKVKVEKDGYM